MTDPVKTFLDLAGDLDYPLFIVTAAEGEQREGCVIGFATQSSFDPARFLFAGEIVERFDLGDPMGFLLDPFAAQHDETCEILYFQRVKYIEPGHPAT